MGQPGQVLGLPPNGPTCRALARGTIGPGSGNLAPCCPAVATHSPLPAPRYVRRSSRKDCARSWCWAWSSLAERPRRAVGHRRKDPCRLRIGPGLAPGRRRARGPAHRADRPVDVRAPDRAAHLSRGARRPDLRVLGPSHGPRRHRDHDRLLIMPGARVGQREDVVSGLGLSLTGAVVPVVAAPYVSGGPGRAPSR
jgi:hypothetical protein